MYVYMYACVDSAIKPTAHKVNGFDGPILTLISASWSLFLNWVWYSCRGPVGET